jgi:hypothetical protein
VPRFGERAQPAYDRIRRASDVPAATASAATRSPDRANRVPGQRIGFAQVGAGGWVSRGAGAARSCIGTDFPVSAFAPARVEAPRTRSGMQLRLSDAGRAVAELSMGATAGGAGVRARLEPRPTDTRWMVSEGALVARAVAHASRAARRGDSNQSEVCRSQLDDHPGNATSARRFCR